MSQSQCQVKVENENSLTTISVAGRLDGFGHKQFNKILTSRFVNPVNYLLIDFTDVSCVSSINLRSLLHTYKVMAAENRMSVCCRSGEIKEVLEFAGFSQLVPIYEDVESAKNAIFEMSATSEH